MNEISLRDHFASIALQCILNNKEMVFEIAKNSEPNEADQNISRAAYEVADAMLIVRSEK